jgi:hypothetical protein
MFEGLSKRETVAWVVCLTLAVGLTILGSAYLVSSYMTADISDVLKNTDRAKQELRK